jgi:hypothetical protein
VTAKSAFLALGEPMTLASARRSPLMMGLALPKFVKRGNFSGNKLATRGVSVKIDHPADELT